LLLLILIVYISNWHQYITLEWIHTEAERLRSLVNEHPFLAPLIFCSIYVLSVILIIPDSSLLTILGGLLFPLPLALTYALVCETLGAWIFFFIFKCFFKKSFLKEKWKQLKKLHREFKKNSVGYLIFLRVSHILPFWLTNIGAAYFKVNPWTFIWTCFVGVIPITYVLANAGHRLQELFATHPSLTLSDIFTPQVKLALFFIGLLAFIPLIFHKWVRRKI
jgi:uncharacterized membrane protein YdjX (TVP38/TMEM64 family)